MSDDTIESHEYRYPLYRFDRDDLSGYIDMVVNPDGLMVEDYTVGKSTEIFFGREDHEYTVSLNRDKAEKVLNAYGISPGIYPAEKLALRFAERYTGDSCAASKFKEVVESAGVKPEVFVW